LQPFAVIVWCLVLLVLGASFWDGEAHPNSRHISGRGKIRVMTVNLREGFLDQAPEAPGTANGSPSEPNERCGTADADYDIDPSNDVRGEDETGDCSKELPLLTRRLNFLFHDATPAFSDLYPDIIFVQEANRRSLKVLVRKLNERLRPRGLFRIGKVLPRNPEQSDGPGGAVDDCNGNNGRVVADSGIIFNAETMTYRHGGVFDLRYGCEIAAKGQPVEHHRALFGLVEERASRKRVAVMSVHMTSMDEIKPAVVQEKWEQWADGMMAKLRRSYPGVNSRIIAGDLNNHMCAAFPSTSKESDDCKKTPFWSAFDERGYRDVIQRRISNREAHYTKPTDGGRGRRIDFIFYQGDRICSATTDNEARHASKYVASNGDPTWAHYISDHRPVFATLRITNSRC
jgi:endonuclease/exonuclease/phosphatase family metal-dependent hydrolase